MKKQERKALREKLILAIKKQLLDSNAEVSTKFDKTVKKSIKQIVKKAKKRKTIPASQLIKPTTSVKTKKVAKRAEKIKK